MKRHLENAFLWLFAFASLALLVVFFVDINNFQAEEFKGVEANKKSISAQNASQTQAPILTTQNALQAQTPILAAQNAFKMPQNVAFSQRQENAKMPSPTSTQENSRLVKGLFVDYFVESKNSAQTNKQPSNEPAIQAKLANLAEFFAKKEQNSSEFSSQNEVNSAFSKGKANFNFSKNETNSVFAKDETNSAFLKKSANLPEFPYKIQPNFANFFPQTTFEGLKLFAFNDNADFFSPVISDYFDFYLPKDTTDRTSKPTQKPQKPTTTKGTKPKLAIIIDDMATREQVRQLKATKLKLTPSFFPPDSNHPRTHILAREFEFFMVHLPLSAEHYTNEEPQTLYPSDTQEYIEAEIARIKRAFRGVKFINNHTGSLFTSDTQAMRRLFGALRKHKLIFVDSLTSGASKGAFVAREFNQTPMKRDIFLDNNDEIEAIKAQINEAVNIARRNGFAIAIAHPKKNTFKALTQSKDLLESVNLVYVSELYESP